MLLLNHEAIYRKQDVMFSHADYFRKRSKESKPLRVYAVIKGKSKRQVFPEGAIEELRSRLEIDETSETGLRWKDVDKNRKHLRGKPAGGPGGKDESYFVICNFCIQGILYKILVSHIVWMLATNEMIKAGLVVNHKNRIRKDNRFENLTLETYSSNNTNKAATGKSGYKNVNIYKKENKGGEEVITYRSRFSWEGVDYCSVSNALSVHACYVFVLGWELLTSGKVPLACVKSQTDEYLCGSELERAMKECADKGIPITPPKYKTLYEYIASVEVA
jgi:hypothetical protein